MKGSRKTLIFLIFCKENKKFAQQAQCNDGEMFNKTGLEVIYRKELKTYFKLPPKLSECGAGLARGYQDQVIDKLLVMRKKGGWA